MSTYAWMGRRLDAPIFKSEVLDIRLIRTDQEHPVTLRCKSSLGMTLMEIGKLSAAKAFLTEADEA